MTFISDITQELQQEAQVTRRYLAAVPFDQAFYRPHVKSESLGRLSIHVVEVIGWWTSCIQDSELNFIDLQPKAISSTQELLAYFDELLKETIETLQIAKDEDLDMSWSMRHGDDILFTLPKREVLRKFCMNHHIHHRAQLGVYLRLLDISVPAAHGPSSDDYEVTLVEPFIS